MNIAETCVDGAYVVTPSISTDERGYFSRLYCAETFRSHDLETGFVQVNNSLTKNRGTVRGLHAQASPHAEAKLIKCVRGSIYDVIVDLRKSSQTYLAWFGVELSVKNRFMMYLPKGVAHGFQSLLPETEIIYAASAYYVPDCEIGVRWDDPLFNIAWPIALPSDISDKDVSWPDYRP